MKITFIYIYIYIAVKFFFFFLILQSKFYVQNQIAILKITIIMYYNLISFQINPKGDIYSTSKNINRYLYMCVYIYIMRTYLYVNFNGV